MPVVSQLIMILCLGSTDPKCIEDLHVCMRENFAVNFYDKLKPWQESYLPAMLRYCEKEREK